MSTNFRQEERDKEQKQQQQQHRQEEEEKYHQSNENGDSLLLQHDGQEEKDPPAVVGAAAAVVEQRRIRLLDPSLIASRRLLSLEGVVVLPTTEDEAKSGHGRGTTFTPETQPLQNAEKSNDDDKNINDEDNGEKSCGNASERSFEPSSLASSSFTIRHFYPWRLIIMPPRNQQAHAQQSEGGVEESSQEKEGRGKDCTDSASSLSTRTLEQQRVHLFFPPHTDYLQLRRQQNISWSESRLREGMLMAHENLQPLILQNFSRAQDDNHKNLWSLLLQNCDIPADATWTTTKISRVVTDPSSDPFYTKALQCFQQGLDLTPRHVHLLLAVSVLEAAVGSKFDESIAKLKEAISLLREQEEKRATEEGTEEEQKKTSTNAKISSYPWLLAAQFYLQTVQQLQQQSQQQAEAAMAMAPPRTSGLVHKSAKALQDASLERFFLMTGNRGAAARRQNNNNMHDEAYPLLDDDDGNDHASMPASDDDDDDSSAQLRRHEQKRRRRHTERKSHTKRRRRSTKRRERCDSDDNDSSSSFSGSATLGRDRKKRRKKEKKATRRRSRRNSKHDDTSDSDPEDASNSKRKRGRRRRRRRQTKDDESLASTSSSSRDERRRRRRRERHSKYEDEHEENRHRRKRSKRKSRSSSSDEEKDEKQKRKSKTQERRQQQQQHHGQGRHDSDDDPSFVLVGAANSKRKDHDDYDSMDPQRGNKNKTKKLSREDSDDNKHGHHKKFDRKAQGTEPVDELARLNAQDIPDDQADMDSLGEVRTAAVGNKQIQSPPPPNQQYPQGSNEMQSHASSFVALLPLPPQLSQAQGGIAAVVSRFPTRNNNNHNDGSGSDSSSYCRDNRGSRNHDSRSGSSSSSIHSSMCTPDSFTVTRKRQHKLKRRQGESASSSVETG